MRRPIAGCAGVFPGNFWVQKIGARSADFSRSQTTADAKKDREDKNREPEGFAQAGQRVIPLDRAPAGRGRKSMRSARAPDRLRLSAGLQSVAAALLSVNQPQLRSGR